MIFINDVRYVKVWDVQYYEKYIKLQTSTGDKKQDGSYENSSWFIKLVGKAFEQGKHLKKGDTITINKGKITNIYNAEKKTSYLDLVAFDIEAPSYEQTYQQPVEKAQDQFSGFASMDDDIIPF